MTECSAHVKKILFIDDQIDTCRQIICFLTANLDVEIDISPTIEGAIYKIFNNRYDLIIMDMILRPVRDENISKMIGTYATESLMNEFEHHIGMTFLKIIRQGFLDCNPLHYHVKDTPIIVNSFSKASVLNINGLQNVKLHSKADEIVELCEKMVELGIRKKLKKLAGG
jgi:hypothetical protein